MNKVIFFTGSQSLSGGTERACADVANLLIEDGSYDIEILSVYSGKESYYPINPKVVLSELHSTRPNGIFSALVDFSRLFIAVRQRQPDVLVAVESLSFLYFILLFFCGGPKLVCWEHFNASIDLGLKSRRLARWLAVRFAERIIVLSDQDQELWIQRLKCAPDKLRRIYNVNPFDGLLDFKSEAGSLENGQLAENSLSLPRTRVVLAAGRMTVQKGFDLLLTAWSEIPATIRQGWLLKILGDGPLRGSLESQIRELNLMDEVLMPGQTRDIRAEYLKADLFVLSSRFEGFGLVLVEALTCGIPVVSFDCPAGPSEIICDGINGTLVPLGDIPALAKNLRWLMSNDVERQKMGKRAPESVNIFSRERVGREWIALMHSLSVVRRCK